MAADVVKHAKRGAPERVVVTVERMVHGGAALARTGRGAVALVTGAVPGEKVEALLLTEKGVLQGPAVAVIVASPDRVEAGPHPGLDYAFMSYPRQLREKAAVVADALTRARRQVGGGARYRSREGAPGRPDEGAGTGPTGFAAGSAGAGVPAVVQAPAQWGYRNTVQPAAVAAGLGYRRRGSAEVVVLKGDPTATPAVDAAWRELVSLGVNRAPGVREVVIRANDAGDALVALVSTAPERVLVPLAHALVRAGLAGVVHAPHDPRGRFRSGSRRLAGVRTITQAFGAFDLTVNATSFAQPNAAAAAALYAELAAWAGEGRVAVELFAGGGAISFHLARRFERVVAVEIDRGAVARGERDAARLGIDNVEFVREDASAADVQASVELVVVDPPRAGLSAATRTAIAAGGAARLLYVSCDVATWARDVADLELRGFVLTRYLPFDFYPQTHHVEVLSELTRV